MKKVRNIFLYGTLLLLCLAYPYLQSQHAGIKPSELVPVQVNLVPNSVSPEISLIQKGRELFLEGRMDEALQTFEEAIALNPQRLDPYLGMGIIFMHLEKWDEAEKIIRKAERFCPVEDEVPFFLAKVYEMKARIRGNYESDWDLAKLYYAKALELQTPDAGYALDPVFAYETAAEFQPKLEIYSELLAVTTLRHPQEFDYLSDIEKFFDFRETGQTENFEFYLRNKDFQKLEEIFSTIAAKKNKDTNGFRESFKLRGLSFSPKNIHPNAFLYYKSLLNEWQEKFPSSPYAQASNGFFFLEAAWKKVYYLGMEGHGWGFEGDEWREYKDFLLLARYYLEKAVEYGFNDPIIFADLMMIATNLGLNRQALDHYYESALKADPTEFLPYARKLEYLKPRWHGSIPEMLTYARTCATLTGSLAPLVIPMAHFEASIWTGNQDYFKSSQIWSEVERTLLNLLKSFPQSLKVHNWYAKLAFLAGKSEIAKKEFEIIKSDWSEECWGNFKKFNRARKTIFKGIPPSLESQSPKDSLKSDFSISKPTPVPSPANATNSEFKQFIFPNRRMSGGNQHSIFIKDDGTVWTWGSGKEFLGDGVSQSRLSPEIVPGIDQAIAVSAFKNGNFVLKKDGTLWVWQSDTTPDKKNPDAFLPHQGFHLENVIDVAGGDVSEAMTLKKDGSVWRLLDDSSGQIVQFRVQGLNDIKSISISPMRALALRKDGTVWSWGNNSNGQLGIGPVLKFVSFPEMLPKFEGIISIAAGESHSLALKNDGTVWSWGTNSWGELGDCSTQDRMTPVKVASLTDVIAIAAGENLSVALRKDGTVWTWGRNDFGQLGHESSEASIGASLQPQQTLKLSDVVAIGCGRKNTYALKKDGTLLAWGNNFFGQIGDGTAGESNLKRPVPVMVKFR
ncbi:MAG: tetratricopeptide repeat protein [Candidatus Riflebacteria bacterium]|nr:tetratricopeptide repeat protein [Candidatus Riflebacteria bacterium]